MKKTIALLVLAFCLNAKAQVVTNLAGCYSIGSSNGASTAACFRNPMGVVADNSGNLYIADNDNNEIRKIVVATALVTSFSYGFYHPSGITIDGSGNLYIADAFNNEIRKLVIATGVLSTLAGSTTAGSADGTGTAASFNRPQGIVYDGIGNLYVADLNNNMIRKIVISTGVVSTLAGNTTAGSLNGTGTTASFHNPIAVATDGLGNLYVSDYSNNEIRKIIISSGVVSTFAGSTTAGSTDSTGTAASFSEPWGLVFDGSGNLYIVDSSNSKIRKISIANAKVTTFVTLGSMTGPTGIAIDGSGNLYVTDIGDENILEITTNSAGINQISGLNTNISIYPNPSNGVFNLSISQFDNLKTHSIEVYNTIGDCVHRQIAASANCQIDLSDLAEGAYNILIQNSQFTSNKKVVIVR